MSRIEPLSVLLCDYFWQPRTIGFFSATAGLLV